MKALYLFIPLLIISLHTYAQDRVWRKQVSRIVVTADTGMGRNSISAIIIAGIKTGKVGAYSIMNDAFTSKMPEKELLDIIVPQPDTVTLVDPVDGREIIKIIQNECLPKDIFQYRVWEEWIYNPATGKATIQIKYIAPMIDIYGDDRVFRAKKILFWVSYKDFHDLLEQDKKKQQQFVFNKCLWHSYFEPASNINTKKGVWSGTATSMIDMREIQDTVTHFLRSESPDTTLAMLLEHRIMNDKLIAWSVTPPIFSKQLTKTEFTDIIIPFADTTVLQDPVNRAEVIKLTYKNLMKRVFLYYILQNWSFDPLNGKTEIAITGAGPKIYDNADDSISTTAPKFWIRYNDLQPTLNKLEESHPTNTFAMHIWDSFFLSDTKPTLVKP